MRRESRLPEGPCNWQLATGELGRGQHGAESLNFPGSTEKGMGQEQGTEIVNNPTSNRCGRK